MATVLLSSGNVLSLVVASVLLTTAAYASDCGFPPEEPPLPDGASASLSELQQASVLVRDFIEVAGNYLVCASNNRDIELTPLDFEQQAAWEQQFAALVAARDSIAHRFNLQVAAFQVANSNDYPLDVAP